MGVVPSIDGDDLKGLLDAEQQGQGAIPRAIEQIFSDLSARQDLSADQAYGYMLKFTLR